MNKNRDIEQIQIDRTNSRFGVERIVGLRTIGMSNDDVRDMFMQFLGFDKVRVEWFGTEEETGWQRANGEWMDKVCLESVGDYFVRVETDDWHEVCDVRIWRSWRWIMLILGKLHRLGKMPVITPSKKTMYKICVDIVKGL